MPWLAADSRRQRGVATVIGAALLALALLAIIAFYIYVTREHYETMRTVGQLVETKLNAPLLASSVKGYYTVTPTGDLQVNITNYAPRTILVTGIAILWSDNTTTIIDKWNGTLSQLDIEAILVLGGKVAANVSQLPAAVAPGETLSLTFKGYARSRTPRVISAALSASPIVAVIPVHAYSPPGNITVIQRPTPYSEILLPEALSGYVVAEKVFEARLGVGGWLIPSRVEVVTGTLISGSASDVAARDNSFLVVQAAREPRCQRYNGWQYYRVITIHNPNPYDYTGIQVKIVLNTSNFDFSKALPNGSDVRVALNDASCTPLPYWVEKWDSEHGEAIIWVKLPSIPANGTVELLLLYGNPSATQPDPDYYGLTKVMEQLPASDGPGYTIQYEEWIMGQNLFQEIGSAQGWHGDDSYWSYSLPFSFPYYSRSYTRIYVESNGFISFDRGYTDYTSTIGEFERRRMISPFWADLMTDCSGCDIFIDPNYADDFGNGVYIRWRTCFYYYNGRQNFAVVLYSNGLIRFDYGAINGRSYTDYTQVVGVSYGDGSHYTISSYDYSRLNGYPSNYPSIMFWPRKKPAGQELEAIIGSEALNIGYFVKVRVSYEASGQLLYMSNFTVYALFNSSAAAYYSVGVYSSSTLVASRKGSTESPLDITLNMGKVVATPLYAEVAVFLPSPFILSIDVANGFANPIFLDKVEVAIVSNESSSLYLFNPSTNTTSVYELPAVLPSAGYTALAMDPIPRGATTYLWVARGTTVLPFNMWTHSWNTSMSITLQEPLHAGGFIASNGTHLFYCPGGGSVNLYVYNISSRSLVAVRQLPFNVTEWAATAHAGTLLYIHPGGRDRVFIVDLASIASISQLSAPALYPTGLCVDSNGRLWLIARGGGLFYYSPRETKWYTFTVTLPYYPLAPGDRLVCIGYRLYHVRGDGTATILVVKTS